MTKTALLLGLAPLALCAVTARAEPHYLRCWSLTEGPPGHAPSDVAVARLLVPVPEALDEPSTISAAPEPTVDAAAIAADEAAERATATAMRGWMRSLGAGLAALLAIALASIGLGRLGQLRRPLALTISGRGPVPAAVVLSLLSPVLPPLVLMHAEREILPSPVLLLAAATAAMALSMLWARRRLVTRLGAALTGSPLGGLADGTQVLVELEGKRLVPPPGARGRVPWFVADLTAQVEGEAARVALAQADVDDGAARILARLAGGGELDGERLTVFGAAVRVPADAESADPLCRSAPTQARIGRGSLGRAIIAGGTPASLLRRLQLECLLLAFLSAICLGAAGIAFFS